MDDKEITLKEELSKYNYENIYIGARSSFFFIGPAKEALDNLQLLASMLNHIAFISHRSKRHKFASVEDGIKLGMRKVINTYEHELGGSVILIEGKEFGMFWTRGEYLAERNKLLKSI